MAKLRQINGIESKRSRRFKVTTKSKKTKWIAPNRLDRCFKADHPNQKWVGDVTFIATRKGWMYLSILLDLYSRKVIGWSISNSNDKKLVLDALNMAIMRRKPKNKVIHHTDRGAVYASDEYRDMLATNKLVASMSRKADCYDNAVAESFFSTLKNELIWKQIPESRKQAKLMISEYIEVFYNRQRVHQSLNYVTPEKFEMIGVPV